MTKLILVRHGESTWNQTGRYQGRIDTELSELGQKQAALLAEHLKSTRLDAIYSSPLRRALHTAIAIGLAQNLDIQVEEDLTEIDHGLWNGLLRSEVEKRFGPLLQQWFTAPSLVQMPKGESLLQVSQRAKRVVDRIVSRHSQGVVALCSHNAVLKVIIATYLGMSLDQFWAIGIDNTSVSVIEFADGQARLLCMNDTCHLGGLHSNETGQAL